MDQFRHRSFRDKSGKRYCRNENKKRTNDHFQKCIRINYFPLKLAFLFSKNAVVPSFISSVAKQFPNSFISNSKPFLVSSKTALAVLIQAATASGALLFIVSSI